MTFELKKLQQVDYWTGLLNINGIKFIKDHLLNILAQFLVFFFYISNLLRVKTFHINHNLSSFLKPTFILGSYFNALSVEVVCLGCFKKVVILTTYWVIQKYE